MYFLLYLRTKTQREKLAGTGVSKPGERNKESRGQREMTETGVSELQGCTAKFIKQEANYDHHLIILHQKTQLSLHVANDVWD